ncbi:MAG TPA: DUF2238 domain-containing protein [Blastocatellia bacterium]|jgi:putative membrane protein|nr:DUF2238 domain-containing protein [Blastocatellia bacterium]
MKKSSLLASLLLVLLLVFIWSAIRPHDYFTWLLEVLPAMAAVALLWATRSRFEFTSLAYILIAVHAVVLMVGGHYTYAEVPLFDWVRDALGLERNHYDRLGHFIQGFVPAIVAREILLRQSPLRRGKWLFAVVVSFCLSISAFYELIEWWVALATGSAAEAFLGTQGDAWDTQWDMALALSGAVTSLLIFQGLHDRQLDRLEAKRSHSISA